MALSQIQVPYKNGYDFGIGVDLATGSPMNRVVVPDASGVQGAAGGIVGFEISRIETTSELETALGIDAEASYGCSAFSGVSARFNYAQRAKIQSSSLFMAITANVGLAFQSIDEPTLTPPAIEMVNRNDVFPVRYGNMFVRGIGRGGLFIGVIQINTSSAEESKTISAELKGSYGLFSAAAKTKFEEVQKNYSSDIKISVYHEGGPVSLTMNDITKPNDLYTVLQLWLTSFQVDPNNNAVPYFVTLAPVSIANGPIPPNEADIQHAQDVLVQCAKERSRKLDGLNLMDYIVQNADSFDFVAPISLAQVVQAQNGYQADLDLIAATASQAINDVTKAMFPADFALKTGKTYPLGLPPLPTPGLKKGVAKPKTVPNFVGLSWSAADELSKQTGIQLFEEDTQEHPKFMGGAVEREHSIDQIVVNWQAQSPGSILQKPPQSLVNGDYLLVTYDLAPGVS